MKIQAPDGTNYPILIADKPLGTVNRGVIRGRKALIEGILSERAGSEPNLFYHSPRLGSSSIVPSVVEHAHAKAPSERRFILELPLKSWSFADLASITFYGIVEGSSYALAIDKAGYHLSSGVVNRHNVYPLISHPATRISDRETLIAYATDALHGRPTIQRLLRRVSAQLDIESWKIIGRPMAA